MVSRFYRKQMRKLKQVEAEQLYWRACEAFDQYSSKRSTIVPNTENHEDSQLAFERMFKNSSEC